MRTGARWPAWPASSSCCTSSASASCSAWSRPQHYHLGGDHPVFTVGVGVLAYTFGLRHAFDADHIAAVDNTTRKLMADNAAHRQRAASRCRSASGSRSATRRSCSRWRSCSSVGVKALAGPVEDDSSELHSVTGVIGASVSGVFLWILGILNLVVLLGIIKVFREMRARPLRRGSSSRSSSTSAAS